jgi:hypothetical protein
MNISEILTSMNLKQRIAAAITGTVLAGSSYYYLHGSTITPAEAVNSNMGKEVVTKFTVLSGKDFGTKSFVLNDTVDYKASTITVYVDKAKCPGLSFAGLQGKTISVRGSVGEWTDKMGKKKPEIKVTNPSQITIN